MRNKNLALKKAAAARKAAAEELTIEYDAFRAHLSLSLVSDMFEHHQACGFKDCRAAGRCLAFDKAAGLCPMPLDTTQALIFTGMMLFDNAMRWEEMPFHATRRAQEMLIEDVLRAGLLGEGS